ncbi:MAG: hypothetical protein NTW69_00890, partial [Chloroflexi bacterium]|nr:hypothetical protein [Chloroflexota bacterium]
MPYIANIMTGGSIIESKLSGGGAEGGRGGLGISTVLTGNSHGSRGVIPKDLRETAGLSSTFLVGFAKSVNENSLPMNL